MDPLRRHAKRLPARDEEAGPGRPRGQGLHQSGDVIDEMLAAVEEKQHGALPELLRQLSELIGGPEDTTCPFCHGRREQCRIRERSQIDEGDPIREAVEIALSEADGNCRLTDAPRADDGQDLEVAELPVEQVELAVPPDDASTLPRQGTPN